ncbi:MAG: DUF547 domain-containing protein [Armatimonadetes bacterium]|nr:DUF547 domain-containing protein [Armatimonadota bacterium]
MSLVAAGQATADPTPDYGVHAPFDKLLQANVRDGLVSYAGLDGSPEFATYLQTLRTTDPASLTEPAAKMAFYLNAYNALVIADIVAGKQAGHYRGVGEFASSEGSSLKRFFKETRHQLGGRDMTLDQIETLIRETFHDPRVHAAVNCASRSCPPLQSHAWPVNGGALDRRLDEAMRQFISNPSRNTIDPAGRRLALSQIFKWYASDFGAGEAALRAYLAHYLEGDRKQLLQDATVPISYLKYDWALNGR